MGRFKLICLLGASLRLLIYRVLGNKQITLKELTDQTDEKQSLKSVVCGFVFIVILCVLIDRLT